MLFFFSGFYVPPFPGIRFMFCHFRKIPSFTSIISVTFPSVMFPRFQKIPFHVPSLPKFRLRFAPFARFFRLLCSMISGNSRLSLPPFPRCFRLLCSIISGIFRLSFSGIFRLLCSTISAKFRLSSSVIFPSLMFLHFRKNPSCISTISVIFPSLLLHHFRKIMSFMSTMSLIVQSFMFHQFRKNPSVISKISVSMFRHFRFFRRPTVLAGWDEVDPGLFAVETETRQYVLLGIISGCPKLPVLFFVFFFRKFSSFIVHHFRLFIFVHFRIIPSCFRFASQLIFSGYSITSGNMSEGFYFSFSIISGNFRHSYFIICGLLCISEKIRLASNSCPNPSFPHVFCCFFNVPSFPEISVIHIHFRFISGLFRRSYFIISGLLCIFEIFRLVSISLPSPSMPDVRSFLLCITSGNFRHSCLIISVSFPIIPSSYFRKFPA